MDPIGREKLEFEILIYIKQNERKGEFFAVNEKFQF